MKHIKIVAVGDGAVGKTCMLTCYTTGNFPEEYVPTIFDNYSQSISIDGQNVNLQLWDTAGQEDYEKIRPMSYPDTDVFLVCFSLVNPVSLENVENVWINEITTGTPKAKKILVGLKKDLRDNFDPAVDPTAKPVTAEEGQKVAQKIGASKYMECSARTKDGLNEIFAEAGRLIIHPQVEPKDAKKKDTNCLLL
ncbi:multidrug resistance protein, putative [Trichomonas vaginalis G3]|uniref:Multidrug resistance protein, putative n=1 Tax=Trichomonas vaginalis (strain ATCC PRA-98 / G3) TaxID=412133 RepID=A2G1A1_TRIV3|nr:small GTPase mediated signal transduction [Trichomonas vaginalis G3]EAX89059.1 multidrug resistance protein, putative [Trichomonas vaginalis G3]KAI5536920.1 small GTPase mediated signal transduction [Trichomonas vaginalis G3]|eukprot:XP_001301989.1 multidrug resistance protein [Trichomonas vaginalis G3]